MVKNITEEVITPDVPKVLPRDQVHVYVPVAGPGKSGIAGYNEEDFDVANGIVSINSKKKQKYEEDLEYLQERVAYDYIVTTEEEFANMPNLNGRVLIKNVTVNNSYSLSVTNLHELNILGLHIKGVVTLIGNCIFRCIKGCNVSGTLTLSGFSGVYDLMSFSTGNVNLLSCSSVNGCVFTTARNCGYISDSVAGGNSVVIDSCHHLHGIKASSSTSSAVFTNCQYLSNIEVVGKYENCSYVDEATCKGYIPVEDVGKVRVLNANGNYVVTSVSNGIKLVYNSTDYKFYVQLTTIDGTVIESNIIDLPIEEMVVDAALSEDGTMLILTLKNGNSLEVDVSKILSGIATEEYVDNKVESLVGDFDTALDNAIALCDHYINGGA